MTRIPACIVAAIALIGIGAPAALAQEALTIEPVKDGLYAIYGSGGNVGVRLSEEGVILIDDKFPQNFEEIQALVAQVSDQPVRYVLNTHHHGDHAGGNVEYIEIAEIIAHQNARDNMVRGDQDAPPRVVFNDQTAVYLGDVEVRAFYMGRGHTNGDAVIYFPDLRTVHGGDLLHGTAPFIDYANGGSSREWVSTLNNILALDFDTAIPGHGQLMTRADVQPDGSRSRPHGGAGPRRCLQRGSRRTDPHARAQLDDGRKRALHGEEYSGPVRGDRGGGGAVGG
jgi:cyclase